MAVPVVQGMVQGEGQVLPPVKAEMGSSRAWSVYDARESCDVGVGGNCSQVARCPRGPCWIASIIGRDVDRGRRDVVRHRRQSFDKGEERGSRRVSITGGGVERTRRNTRHDPDCTRIARADREQEEHATKPIGARVDSCRAWAARCKRRDQALEVFRLTSASLEKADEEVAQSARELAVLEEELARVQYGPAAEAPAAVAMELARCINKTLGDMKKFHNVPQDHVNEMETSVKNLVEGVVRLATHARVSPVHTEAF